MKKIIRSAMSIFIVLALLVPSMCFAAPDAADVTVLINNYPLESDQPPFVNNERVMVPIRAIFEALSLSVSYDGNSDTMTAVGKLDDSSSVTVEHKIGSSELSVNGKIKTFDTPSMKVNNRTLVPVRMIAEAVNAVVEWDASLKRVRITTAYKTTAEFITYENERYGYAISYPSVFVNALYSDNGDGATLTTADNKGKLLVWGSYNVLDKTPQSIYGEVMKEHPNAKVDLIEDSLNASYTEDENTCFIDYFVTQQTIWAFEITYPTAQKNEYEPYIAKLLKTFRTPR